MSGPRDTAEKAPRPEDGPSWDGIWDGRWHQFRKEDFRAPDIDAEIVGEFGLDPLMDNVKPILVARDLPPVQVATWSRENGWLALQTRLKEIAIVLGGEAKFEQVNENIDGEIVATYLFRFVPSHDPKFCVLCKSGEHKAVRTWL